jgi:hypothetical protein
MAAKLGEPLSVPPDTCSCTALRDGLHLHLTHVLEELR